MLRLLRVSGSSLSPEYQEGDFVLIAKIPLLINRLQPGDIVVFTHPTYGTMIKQVDRFTPFSDEIFVIGSQELSVDSRRFGPISKRSLVGKVVWHIRKRTRRNTPNSSN